MPNVTHEVRNSLADPARLFELEDEGLSWLENGTRKTRRYADIAKVHLIAYPGEGGTRQMQCTLHDRAGCKVKIRSHHYVSLANFEDRTASYGAFMRTLMTRLATSGRDVKYLQGSNIMHMVWLVLFGLSIILLAGFLFALIGGAGGTWDFFVPMAGLALFLPVSWSIIGQGWAGTFDPNNPPAEFLGE